MIHFTDRANYTAFTPNRPGQNSAAFGQWVDPASAITTGNEPDSHSLQYFKRKLASVNWDPGVTKNLQQGKVFCCAASVKLSKDVAVKLVLDKLEAVNAPIDLRAVTRQADRAYEFVGYESEIADVSQRTSRRPSKIEFDIELLRNAVADVPEITDDFLRERSSEWVTTAAEFLAQLYQPGEKIAVFEKFKSRKPEWLWQHGMELGHPSSCEGVYFLCNPVDGQWHPNPRNAGKMSCRSEESITDFRYAVFECDHEKEYPGVNALWLRFLVLLPLRIEAIYTSGGKSIHALVRVDAISKADWDRKRDNLYAELVVHGADPGALSAVRLTRLPFCTRNKTGQEQRLLFLNPRANGRAIYEC